MSSDGFRGLNIVRANRLEKEPDERQERIGHRGRGAGQALRRSGEGTVEAVRGVDLEVRTGEIFGFLGPNGAGKSTTVRMLTTLLTITAGRAEVAGIDVAGDPDEVAQRGSASRCRRRASTPARPAASSWSCTRGCSGSTTAEATERAEELLALVELEDAADRVIKGYSGGMQRRLDLAAALVHEPEILFLDEPTTGLDPASRLTIWEELRRINARGHHDLPDHAVPGGGRSALRPPRDHRRRRDRARGHAGGAEGGPAAAPGRRRGADARRRLPRRDRAHP